MREAPPQVAFILGSGMGPVARRLEQTLALPFLDIPGLKAPSVLGHAGVLTLGDWAGKPVLVFEGRLHYYEGHPWRSVVLPVQTAAYLGVQVLLVTNAAGGIHPALDAGCLMAIRDHVEWNRPRCWHPPAADGTESTRLSPYSSRLLHVLAQAARQGGQELRQGIYAAVTGPNYETPAEIRALQKSGVDAVGMSTTREVLAGFEAGLECAALSCITNRAAGSNTQPICHEEVLRTAAANSDGLADLLERFLQLL